MLILFDLARVKNTSFLISNFFYFFDGFFLDGYLCSTAEEYAQTIVKVAKMSCQERQSIIDYARADVQKRLSGVIFEESIVRSIKQIVV